VSFSGFGGIAKGEGSIFRDFEGIFGPNISDLGLGALGLGLWSLVLGLGALGFEI
jgi:hypothetical protein